MANAENSNPDTSQVEPKTEQIQTELSYQREDGTIEKATSPEEAIARCPYLGRLPLEQANVLLELSRKGQEMMAKADAKPEDIMPVKEAPIIKSKEDKPISTAPKKSEILNTVETVIAPEITAVIQEEYLKPEAVTASKELDTVLKAVNETLLHTKAEHQESVIEKVIAEKIVVKPIIKEVVDEPAPHISSLNEVTQPTPKVEAIQVEANEPIEIVLHAEEKLPSEETVVPIVQAVAPELMEIEPRSETVFQQISEEIIIDHESVETESTAENTFDELIEMLGLPETGFIEIDISPPLVTTDTAEHENGLEAVFESYINAQPTEETVPTIDQIQAQAENKPLEESLNQLASLIVEASPQTETLIAEIFKLTELITVNIDETSIVKLEPETLSKILSLFELIGYENPEKSLLDLVARYDLRFVLSAIAYLHELTDPHKRHEFSITNFLKPIVGAVINPLAEIIGKTVIRFVNV